MTHRSGFASAVVLLLLSACGEQQAPASTFCTDDYRAGLAAAGLDVESLKKGYGRRVEPGDFVTVHYTGWLYDESAEDGRGAKFDSSVDRGQPFSFPLGANRVIAGWDRGVACMLIGEKSVLTIPPELAYGERGAGGGAIPPGATLIFEVEVLGAEAPADE